MLPTAQEIAHQHLAKGDAKGWFEPFYALMHEVGTVPPWSGMEPNRYLKRWVTSSDVQPGGKSALVIACGLGDDAEWLAAQGFDVTAFDISQSAIDWCKQRFPDSSVKYHQADMFASPTDWLTAFDFVWESLTIQSLPPDMYFESVAAVAQYNKPNSDLLLHCLGRPAVIDIEGPPWPLTRDVLDAFQEHGFAEQSFEEMNTGMHTPVQRWLAHFHRT